MAGLIISGVCLAYLVLGFVFARKAYRHEYNLIYGSPAPMIYGGKHGHAKAHEVALREAFPWVPFWLIFCSWELIYWLIAHGTELSWVETANEITQMQTDVNRLAAEQDPLKDLDHTVGEVTVTHKQTDPWLWENPEIIYTKHPEKIITVPKGDCIWTGARWVEDTPENEKIYGRVGQGRALDPLPHSSVLAPTGDCICPKCRPELYMWRQA